MTKDVKNILTVSAVLGALVAGYFFVVQPILENNSMTSKYRGPDMDMTNDPLRKDVPLNSLLASDWLDPVKDYAIDIIENPKYLDPSVVKVKYL
jgi:hypothetical protein